MNIVRSSRTRLVCALTLAIVPITGIAASNAEEAEPTVTGSFVASSADSAQDSQTSSPAPSRQPVRVSTPSSRKITIASPKGNRHLDRSALEDLDVPLTAMIAYRSAARTMRRVAPSCDLDWSLLAAIGRVESNHGRYDGSRLHRNGMARPSIRGLRLDGAGPVAKIRDTDNGSLDGDKVWDRAVGPMQFLPSTWAVVGVDGDGDGKRSPDNINDAALAAAVYLCDQPGNVGTNHGIRRAVYGYNHSDSYVDLVAALVHGFRTGDFSVPSSSLSGSTPEAHATPSTPGTETAPAGSTGADHSPKPSGQPKADHPGKKAKPDRTKPGADEPTVVHAKLTKPPKHNDDPVGFPPDDDPTTPPDPEPEPPVLVALTGTLATCGEADELWCLDDVVLDLGDEEQLAAVAAADLDADGALETNAEELAGLVGQEVALEVEEDTDPAVVHTVNEVDYRLEDGSFAAAPEAD